VSVRVVRGGIRVRILSTQAGRIRLELRRRGHRVASRTVRLRRPGVARVTLRIRSTRRLRLIAREGHATVTRRVPRR
jgi:hypothetical protein